jgi:uncharacterized membrane protein
MRARMISVLAVSIALVAVVIYSVPIPIPVTGGYTHPGAVIEVFVAVAFGPVVGAVAAGVGAALSDLLLGYGTFAPLTLVAHASLGLLVGWLGWRRSWRMKLLGWILGGLALVTFYYVGEATIYQLGAVAAASEVPINLIQVGLGILGLGLYQLVKRAYPPLDNLMADVAFEERDSPSG